MPLVQRCGSELCLYVIMSFISRLGGQEMTINHSQVREVINRNIVISLALEQGFNAFLPVYDGGMDFILYRDSDRELRKVQLKSR